jgi:hypothetical protein
VTDDLARNYIEYWKTRAEDLFWAWEEVDRIVHGVDAETAWALVVRLVEAASDDRAVLGFIGAGPLEDLVRLHAVPLLDRAEEEAKRNAAFAEALRVTRYPGH